MEVIEGYVLPCLYAFLGSAGFCILFNIHGRGIMICCLGGSLGWLVYLGTAGLVGNDVVQAFIASLTVSGYAELMARIRKCPATVYSLIGSLPLVPGAGIYYTMEYGINGEAEKFIESGMHTLSLAGSLALGLLLVASLVRLTRRRR